MSSVYCFSYQHQRKWLQKNPDDWMVVGVKSTITIVRTPNTLWVTALCCDLATLMYMAIHVKTNYIGSIVHNWTSSFFWVELQLEAAFFEKCMSWIYTGGFLSVPLLHSPLYTPEGVSMHFFYEGFALHWSLIMLFVSTWQREDPTVFECESLGQREVFFDIWSGTWWKWNH